jgi:hypothetical protein
MSLTQDQICCLKIKADSCAAAIGYKITLKENKGYCVDELYEKLKYVLSLGKMFAEKLSCGDKTVKNNEIHFCDQKVFLSKNNSLFLTNIDSNSCLEESELAEECCIDLCEVESKLNEICRNC